MDSTSQRERIEGRLEVLFPGVGERVELVRNYALQTICDHIDLGFADRTFVDRIYNLKDETLWQAFSEALVGLNLREAGLTLTPSKAGPDFLIKAPFGRIWVEVICPEPCGVPEDWLRPQINVGGSLPQNELLLRWTSAIHEKAKKLLGDGKGAIGYLEKGIVSRNDGYVIAVNGVLLRSGRWSALTGISQFPFALEATLPVGPYQVHLNRSDLKVASEGHSFQEEVIKTSGTGVSKAIFLNPDFAAVGAVWAFELDATRPLSVVDPRQMIVVHNPLANIPIDVGLLPARREYAVPDIGEVTFSIRVHSGSISEASGPG